MGFFLIALSWVDLYYTHNVWTFNNLTQESKEYRMCSIFPYYYFLSSLSFFCRPLLKCERIHQGHFTMPLLFLFISSFLEHNVGYSRVIAFKRKKSRILNEFEYFQKIFHFKLFCFLQLDLFLEKKKKDFFLVVYKIHAYICDINIWLTWSSNKMQLIHFLLICNQLLFIMTKLNELSFANN